MVQLVIMLVNGNLGTGVAIAGAFGLVRFRSAPGTAREISGVFLSMALGLATGMGYVGLAVVAFVILAAALALLTAVNFGQRSESERVLKITIPESLDYDGLFDDLFDQYTRSHTLERVKTANMGTLYELEYRAPRQVFSADRIMEQVWGWDNEAEINVVWVNISNLRKKLKALGSHTALRANRGLGYLLEAEP